MTFDRPDGVMCANCKQREGSERWIGDGGTLAITHGWFYWWCELCIAEAQLEHAEKSAEGLPKLRERVLELRAGAAA